MLPHPQILRSVIPAKAGIQFAVGADAKVKMDPGFRRDDDICASERIRDLTP